MPAKFSTPFTVLEPGETKIIQVDNFKPQSRLFLRQQNSGEGTIAISFAVRACIIELYDQWMRSERQVKVRRKLWESHNSYTLDLFGIKIDVSAKKNLGKDTYELNLQCRNTNNVSFSFSVDSIVERVHRSTIEQIPTIIELIKGGSCEAELENDGQINLFTPGGKFIGSIVIAGEELRLKGLGEKSIALAEGITKIGRSHQPVGFFTLEDSPFVSRNQLEIEITKLADKKWKLKFIDPGSSNGSQILIPRIGGKAVDSLVENQIRTLVALPLDQVQGRRMLHGGEEQMSPLFEFVNSGADAKPFISPYIVANGCNGEINFSQAHIYGCTVTGCKERDEDGFYANPQARMIAGGDGIGGSSHGELASAAALIGIDIKGADHANSMEMLSMLELPRYMAGIGEKLGITFTEKDLPGTTFGFARERSENGRTFIEGFYSGDYCVLIVDLTTGEIVYKSKPQNKLDELGLTRPFGSVEKTLGGYEYGGPAACIFPYPHTTKIKPASFSRDVPSGGRYMTILYSDGVSFYFTPENVRDFAMEYGDATGRLIVEEALRQGGFDNISYVHMVTKAT